MTVFMLATVLEWPCKKLAGPMEFERLSNFRPQLLQYLRIFPLKYTFKLILRTIDKESIYHKIVLYNFLQVF